MSKRGTAFFDRSTKAIAKALGVTPAGLRWLAAKASINGKASQRGNEVSTLRKLGFVDVLDNHYVVTDAGREVVHRAREMGW